MARNPLLNVRQNTSNDPQPHSGYVAPVPENYAGDNNPYRGLENHGVAPTHSPDDPMVEYDDGEATGLAEYTEAQPEPDPIPVRIVGEGGTAITGRTYQLPIPNDGTPVQVLPRMKERKSAIVKNSGANPTFIAFGREVPTWNAYPLAAGETLNVGAMSEVYAFGGNGTTLSVYVEYTVSQ